MYCYQCGNPIQTADKFCAHCAASQNRLEPSEPQTAKDEQGVEPSVKLTPPTETVCPISDRGTASSVGNDLSNAPEQGSGLFLKLKALPIWAKIVASVAAVAILSSIPLVIFPSNTASDNNGMAGGDASDLSQSSPSSVATPNYVDNHKYGNTSGNNVNGGFFAIQGEWIYYSLVDSDSRNDSDWALCKIKTDGTGKTRLTNGIFESINVIDEWIYCIETEASHGTGGRSIIKIKVDGTEKQTVASDKNFYWLQVVDEWMYYVCADNRLSLGQLYRAQTNGTEKHKIANDVNTLFGGMTVQADTVYWWKKETRGAAGIGPLYKYNTNSMEQTKIYEDYAYDVAGMQFDKEYVFWIKDGAYRNVYKLKYATNNHDLVLKEDKAYDYMSDINVLDGWIYYSDANAFMGIQNGLWRVKVDGTGTEKLLSNSAKRKFIIGDWIYYESDKGKYWRVKTDGTENQQLAGY